MINNHGKKKRREEKRREEKRREERQKHVYILFCIIMFQIKN
jgi:hypothetical protein